MSYFAPYVDSSGLHIPSYSDILADNLSGFQSSFGQNQYVGIDSAIYQLLSIISLKHYDTFQGVQLAYNQSSPATAVGSGLDRTVKMNGLERLPYTFSTAALTLTGTSGTLIVNGYAQDTSGNQWALPASVTIPIGGSIAVTATCTTPGAVVAEPGTIIIIATPVGGWSSVTNAYVSTPGTPVEADSQLRARQAISVAGPSNTRLFGTISDVLAVPGVTNLATYENPTSVASDGSTVYGYPAGTPLPAGLPPHSITLVVGGGTSAAVAQAIYANRGIGCYTNGTTSVVVTDPNTGATMTMRFYRPTLVPIYVSVGAHAPGGVTTSTLAAIKSAVVAYLNALNIGATVGASALEATAMSVNSNLAQPIFLVETLTLGTAPAPTGTADIAMLFYQQAEGIAVNVVVTSV